MRSIPDTHCWGCGRYIEDDEPRWWYKSTMERYAQLYGDCCVELREEPLTTEGLNELYDELVTGRNVMGEAARPSEVKPERSEP